MGVGLIIWENPIVLVGRQSFIQSGYSAYHEHGKVLY